ncbi:u3 small nucleolar rna-associated protein 6 [Nannochloropsis oceanica]
MADAVYQALDRMLPALEDLQVRGLFTAEEVRAIAAKRRDFEFLLRRRTARKSDFLRYITHELNLEELRRLRKNKAGLSKSTVSDHAGKQLVHFIFERALRKFQGDLELWLQYLDYCCSTSSHKAHSRALARALQLFPRTAGLWIRAASFEFFEHSSPPAARVLMQRGLRLNGQESALLWTQYFKLEVLYVNKLRGRRVALGIEEARPRDLDMRLAFVETLEELGGQQQQSETEGEGGREERSEGAFEDLVQEILGGIEEAFGVAEAAWARAKHALTRRGGQVGGEVEVRATTNKRKTNVRRNSSSSSSKKRRYSSSLTATWVDDEKAVTGWREGLEGGARECMAVLDTTLAAAADLDRKAEEDKNGKRYDLLNKIWQYYLRGLLELLHAPGSVLRAAFARREVALSGEGGREGEVAGGLTLEPGMYLIWASLWVAPSVLSSPLAHHVEEDGKEEGNVQEARRVLDKAVKAHPLHARLWEARLRAEAWGEGGRVGDVFTKARQALGPTAGIDELGEGRGSEEEEGEARRIAVAGCWWVYLDWLMLVGGEGKRRKSENTTSGSSESDSDSEAEEGEKDGVEWQEEGKRAVSPEVVKALEHALVSTRGPGRVALCRLWHRCLGRRGLQQAMTHMGDGRAEEREDMAALCLEALNDGKEEAGLTGAWFEAALAVCGKAETEEAAALWEAYEIFERGQGRHQAANNVRWRRGKATGEK